MCYKILITSDAGKNWRIVDCSKINLAIDSINFNPVLTSLQKIGNMVIGRMGRIGIKVSNYGEN